MALSFGVPDVRLNVPEVHGAPEVRGPDAPAARPRRVWAQALFSLSADAGIRPVVGAVLTRKK
jgi:hypothetical protein